MKLSDLHYEEKHAPTKGYCLAYTREKVIFKKYDTFDEMCKFFGDNKELLEIHLFDNKMEYRAIYSNSEKRPIETDAPCDANELDKENVYVIDTYIDSKYNNDQKKIKVVNCLTYDDNGAVRVDDYRLMIGE